MHPLPNQIRDGVDDHAARFISNPELIILLVYVHDWVGARERVCMFHGGGGIVASPILIEKLKCLGEDGNF